MRHNHMRKDPISKDHSFDEDSFTESPRHKSAHTGNVHTITALEPQEKKAWRTSIFIDGKFWRGYDSETVAELGLYEGQKLTDDELENIDHSLERRRAINRAVLLLSYRGRSINEVTGRLTKAGFSADIAAEAVEELKRLGYLDDEDFAQAWTKARIGSKLYGPRRIKQELRQKGVDDEIIDEKLAESSTPEEEFERAMQLAQSKLPSLKGLDRNAAFRRLSQFLLRRGYTPGVVYDVCKQVLSD